MTSAQTEQATAADYERFYRDLDQAHLHPLWQITRELLTPTPKPKAVPWLWPAAVMQPLARRSIDLVPIGRGGERRVLSLGNPGMPGSPYAAGTLWGAIQCLGPGESAPAHRHTPGAIRFVLSGTGVWTTVNGDACDMNPGDLVLTPSWNWHDHTSTGAGGMFWFDGLDLPMVEALDAVFFEPYPKLQQPDEAPHNRSEELWHGRGPAYADGAVRDALGSTPSPLLVYRWADTNANLARLATASSAPMVSVEYVNPETGASALPTLSCAAHRIAPGGRTSPVRRTGNSVFVVYRGSGVSVVDGRRMQWAEGDMFVAPSWSAVEHKSPGGADLFSLGDAPVLRALGLYREQQLTAPQPVVGDYDALPGHGSDNSAAAVVRS